MSCFNFLVGVLTRPKYYCEPCVTRDRKKLHIYANSDSFVCKENMWRKENSKEMKIHVCAKRQTWICTTWLSLRLLVDTAKLLVTPDINSDVWSYNFFCNWALESYVMWNDNERRRDRVEWGGVSKRVWVATLLFPSLVQCSLLRRYHHLEHLITPCSWMLLSGAKRHPQINGQQARV